ncbi:DUF4976 domain-containing protein [Marinilabiliaceae bacterium JC017]|nr:DUF4976 domain-containing protein [Marinilabiliaceae bacterium JC017]
MKQLFPSLQSICLMVMAAGALASCSQSKQQAQAHPNIVFIMTDDHSLQTFSTYDDRFIKTPNLDRIAQEGAVFRNSFVSNSICSPSRAVMLTGKHSHVNGQVHNGCVFDGSQQTFPKLLQAAGYQTSLIGKWHLRSLPTGFNNYDILVGQGNYYNSPFITNGDTLPTDGYVTNVITDKSINWLEHRDKDKPFCLLVHHKATHRIWQPDTALFNLFKGVDFPVPDNFFDDYEGRQAAAEQNMSVIKDMDLVYDLKMLDKEGDIKTKYRKAYEGMLNGLTPEQRAAWDKEYEPVIKAFKKAGLSGKELALWKYQRYMHDYLRCVASVDNNVGRLLDYLDQQGLADNTIVVYTSDQGFYMGEHGWFDKRFMYEESMRTPLVMRYPQKIKPGTEYNQMVQNIDYAPTFLDLAGVKVPADMQGQSLQPLMTSEQPQWRDALYYHYYEFPNEHMVKRHYGIRTNRYKLIHFYNNIDTWELYDLANDPKEMHNLFGQKAYDSLVDSLKQQLHALQVQYGDTITSTY